MNDTDARARAIDNLLFDCAGLARGSSLLLVREDAALGWYDREVADAIAEAAREHGIEVEIIDVGAPQNQPNAAVSNAMQRHDCTLFLARLGDQDRFASPPPGKTLVMCYLRSLDMLGSPFATVSYAATVAVKQALDRLLARARRIEISCPLGTDCRGEAGSTDTAMSDVSVRRFPLGVVTPIDAHRFSGRVAVANYLTPTGSRVYEPAWLALDTEIFARVDSGRIVGFDGDPATVASVERHYRAVAARFEIDPAVVHSWHVGLHPGLSYRQTAADNPDRWSNTIFNHPRILHFHTCGDYAPGEICWILRDPTVTIDGEALWDQGEIRLEGFAETRSCLARWPELERLYREAAGPIGF